MKHVCALVGDLKDVSTSWPAVQPIIERALQMYDSNGFDASDVLHGLYNRTQHMMIIYDEANISLEGIHSVVLAQVIRQNAYDVLDLWLVAGDYFTEWFIEAEEIFSDMARYNGCQYITGEGRDGWKRMLKGLGYQPISVKYRKPLYERDFHIH